MRTFLPIAAVVLLTAGAATLPALTDAQTAKIKHHTWKKTNIDTAAMSASMSAQNPNAFSPPAGDPQPGAISAAQSTDTSAKAEAATTGAHHKTAKHRKHRAKAGESPAMAPPAASAEMPSTSTDTQAPGAITSGASTSSAPGAMPPENGQGNGMSNTTGTASPDAGKAMTTPPAGSSSSSQ